jgi:hypothetical protein
MIKWNEYTWYSKLAAAIFFIIVLPAWTFYIGIQYETTRAVLEQSAPLSAAVPPVSAGDVTCYDSPNYFAIQKLVGTSVGSDILIKYKTSPSQVFPCRYVVAPGDFEETKESAQYFLMLTDHFLLLDQGTAPEPRIYIAYDLASRKKIYSDYYSKPITAVGDTITYWSPTEIRATADNCPVFNDDIAKSLGSLIQVKTSLDLKTLARTNLGPSECVPVQ